jgi:uncharacterized protein YjbI with pentapeptide repeats
MDLKGTLRSHERWLKSGHLEGERADLGSAHDLSGANLRDANLQEADLREAVLNGAGLQKADLSRADARSANLHSADLRWANLTSASLHETDLRYARLDGADLSGAKGLVTPADYIERNFETGNNGVLCYKVFECFYDAPDYWKIEEDSVIEENASPIRTRDCACGINVTTRKWMERNNYTNKAWRCRIAWPDLAGVVVPYNTGGKIRAERVRLLEKVDL